MKKQFILLSIIVAGSASCVNAMEEGKGHHHRETAQILTDAEANKKAEDARGMTALILAVLNGRGDLVQIMLAKEKPSSNDSVVETLSTEESKKEGRG